ncbi:hypothetical protein IKL64_06755 [bacterium]|nr:hypothetical protein [bacterium]
MKKLALLLAVISFSAVSTFAAEPLLLEPLSPSILSTMPTTSAAPAVTTTTGNNGVQVTVGKEGVEANYATKSQMNSNMVPQNAAAKGQPLPERRNPRVKIQTKQGTQGNTQWNAGGRGHKTFF